MRRTILVTVLALASCGEPQAKPTCDQAGAVRAAESEAMVHLGHVLGMYHLSHPTRFNGIARQTRDGDCTWRVRSHVVVERIGNPRDASIHSFVADVELSGNRWRARIK